jgi:hypothetical protein
MDDVNKHDPGYKFNPDPQWIAFALSYEKIIQAIAAKYCASDESLREDCMQEARIALLTVFPEKINGFGTLPEVEWRRGLDRYCRNVIRNSILSYLDSYPKGNMYIGRHRHVKNKKSGLNERKYLPPRFSSLDELTDNHGMQIDENGAISWPEPSDDGIPRHRNLTDD